MNCAYDEMYLSLAQRVMGDMYDFAVNTLDYDIVQFHRMFIVSGIAHQIEIGNPMYVAGKNGCEVARAVITKCGLEEPKNEDVMYLDKSEEYWIGWALAYYQWNTGYRYSDIDQCVRIDELYKMYPVFHETDILLFVESMNRKTRAFMSASRLKRLRSYAKLSQSQLAAVSGISIRQIQLFEQGQRDINKTQGETLEKIAKTLNCGIEDLLN